MRGGRGTLERAVGSLLGLAAVAAIAVGILSIGALRGSVSGSAVAPVTFPGPAMADVGPVAGLVPHPAIEGMVLAFVVLAGGLLALAVGLLVLRHPRGALVALLAGLAIPGAIAVLATMPRVTGDERFGSQTTPISPVEMPPGSTESLLYIAARPGETFQTSFAFVNNGPLPVTVHGIERIAGRPTDPEWVAVNLVPDAVARAPVVGSPIDGEPFAAFRLDAGEARQVLLIGTPGSCAVGAFDPADARAFDYLPVPIRVVYDVAGWPRSEAITLSYRLLVPVSPECVDTAELPSAISTP